MSKTQRSITIDDDIERWLIDESEKRHLDVSTFLNQVLWEVVEKANKKRK